MSDRVFLDTNVIVYAYDQSEPDKQRRAQEILDRSLREGAGVVSGQVLGEFFVTVTRKIPRPVSASDALGVIRLLSALPVVAIDHSMVEAGIALHQRHNISYWDALIIAAAERSSCKFVYSEDLNDGQRFGEVLVANPFR